MLIADDAAKVAPDAGDAAAVGGSAGSAWGTFAAPLLDGAELSGDEAGTTDLLAHLGGAGASDADLPAPPRTSAAAAAAPRAPPPDDADAATTCLFIPSIFGVAESPCAGASDADPPSLSGSKRRREG